MVENVSLSFGLKYKNKYNFVTDGGILKSSVTPQPFLSVKCSPLTFTLAASVSNIPNSPVT